jgi:S1-C subfamily serine protease
VQLSTALGLCLVTALATGVVTAGALSPSTVTADSSTTQATQPAGAAPVAAAVVTDVAADAGSVSQIAKQVGPAVVAIVTGSDTGPGVAGYSVQGAGSGVIVDPSGLILTNGGSLTVFLADGREFDATIEGIDTLTDLALLSIDATDLPAATLGDSSAVEVGELAVAIGNPQGDLPGSVTAGIISALEREIVVGDASGAQAPEALRHLIQHDAAINPGNSGGPLLAGDGSVIAVNTAVAGGAQGIGFAIPINLAKPIVKQVLNGESIQRPYIGIYFTEVDMQMAQDEGLAVDSGVVIRGDAQSARSGVIAGGPADAAGLKDGDVLTQIDGRPIDATHQLDVALLEREPGDTIDLTVVRGAKTLQREVALGVRPAEFVQ